MGVSINHVNMGGGSEGGKPMLILLHKPYYVKWSTKGGGESGVKIPKNLSMWFMDGPYRSPNHESSHESH